MRAREGRDIVTALRRPADGRAAVTDELLADRRHPLLSRRLGVLLAVLAALAAVAMALAGAPAAVAEEAVAPPADQSFVGPDTPLADPAADDGSAPVEEEPVAIEDPVVPAPEPDPVPAEPLPPVLTLPGSVTVTPPAVEVVLPVTETPVPGAPAIPAVVAPEQPPGVPPLSATQSIAPGGAITVDALASTPEAPPDLPPPSGLDDVLKEATSAAAGASSVATDLLTGAGEYGAGAARAAQDAVLADASTARALPAAAGTIASAPTLFQMLAGYAGPGMDLAGATAATSVFQLLVILIAFALLRPPMTTRPVGVRTSGGSADYRAIVFRPG